MSGENVQNSIVWAVASCALEIPKKYGFSYEYTYDKGSDSSCVYIHRFKKGRDFFDLRILSGADTLTIVAYVNGEYVFPSLQQKYKKQFRAFKIRHIFRRADERKKWAFYADILETEAQSGSIFGIPV